MDERILSRDVPATLVPYGDALTLPAGTAVTITHRLGGNFTVLYEQGMARIDGEHAEALGEEPVARPKPAARSGDEDGPPSEEELWTALRTVFDPEIPVNIVDLGLVYDLQVKPEEDGYDAHARITLTAPGCGMGPAIADDARRRLESVPGVRAAHVELVWDPPWSQEMISEEGKMQLGLI